MTTLAVILARAGSVGLPDKHLRPLLGRPVVAYTFDHAYDAVLVDRVLVTTDSPGVRQAAGRAGLATVDRPAELATGDASVQDVLLHALAADDAAAAAAGDAPADAVVCLYGNVPVRPPGVIDAAVDLLRESGCDSVRSFCPVGKWHPAWMATLAGDRVTALHAGSVHRRQDLSPLHLHDGAVVAVSRRALVAAAGRRADPHAFFGSDRRAVATGVGDTVEIDHQRDLYWAEAVLRDRRPPVRLRRAG